MPKQLGLFIVAACIALSGCSKHPTDPLLSSSATEIPGVEQGTGTRRSARFVPWSTNKYFPLVPGTRFKYRSETDEGVETEIVTVTHRTKRIQGVVTRVVEDVVKVDGEVVEHTLDWYAMDREGNVWYFGEDSRTYENGKLVNTEGSWIAGEDGAEAGIIMKARPKVGDSYDEENAPDVAEDHATVLALDQKVRVPAGRYRGVLQTENTTPLEPDVLEHKYYAPGVGMVLEVDVSGGGTRNELVSVGKARQGRDRDRDRDDDD
jgi:hypothetical protein